MILYNNITYIRWIGRTSQFSARWTVHAARVIVSARQRLPRASCTGSHILAGTHARVYFFPTARSPLSPRTNIAHYVVSREIEITVNICSVPPTKHIPLSPIYDTHI